ncbi:hypothetical protein [Methylobacterium trifolii]|uniref:Phage tail protein n=1 Tax=Methylobacterium trifolii TaxID=1003092 RepID=A0ABQ4U3G2_9HYPH|nr:hypothetical protein [Methylobacterium trifolii]GJE61697.1 hypothetical protein MPOCJGCO_3820 [Methylobacterium trifolii]
MADPTVSVTAGSTDVVGVGTSFIERRGDLFILAGLTVPISYSTPSRLTLTQPWPGATLAGRTDFATQRSGPYWSTTVTTNEQLTDLIGKLDAALPLKFDAAGPFTQRASLNNQPAGFVFLSVDPAPFTLYVKLANSNSEADWSAGQQVKTTPAQSTADAQAAAVQAQSAASLSNDKAALATSAAGTAAGAAAATSADRTQTGSDRAATSADRIQTGQDRATTSGAATAATGAAGTATTQAGIAVTARQVTESARDVTLPAAAQAVAANSTAQSAAGTSISKAAEAQGYAADARQYAAALALAAFDFSFDSASDISNDWSNG